MLGVRYKGQVFSKQCFLTVSTLEGDPYCSNNKNLSFLIYYKPLSDAILICQEIKKK